MPARPRVRPSTAWSPASTPPGRCSSCSRSAPCRRVDGIEDVCHAVRHDREQARLAFDLVPNTWNAVVIWALKDGPLRHSELRGAIGGISAKVLTETLRRLTEYGLVRRGTNSPASAGACSDRSRRWASGRTSTARRSRS
nr:helix-turn-helix domain-containing protein [Actinosynnema sp. ALI-1.44]